MRRTSRSIPALAMTAAVTMSLASLTLVAPASAATVPPPVPPSNPPRTAVDPLTLDRGPNPRVVYYDQRQKVIHDGAREIPARFPGTVSNLARAAGGYVVDSETGTRSVLRLVSRTGRARVLARVANLGIFGRVSADGRRLVYYPSVSTFRAVVLRLPDGKVLASRTFGNPPTVASVRSGRALLSNAVHTYWWRYRSNTLVRVAPDSVSQAALDVDRVALYSAATGERYMTSLGVGGPSWSWPAGQSAGRFSPDGRRFLTLTPRPASRYEGQYAAIRVRASQDGRIARVFTGLFGVESYPQDPRWETSSTFLALGVAEPTADNIERLAWVRCTVGGSCERAGPVFRVRQGPSPWVLADQPTH